LVSRRPTRCRPHPGLYISRDSAFYAAAVGRRIIASSERLERYPRLGRAVPELGSVSVRELIVGNYRLIYRLRGEYVEIERVLHGSQDLLRNMGPQPWDAE
jgi:plasmid stabilization system protein ParE